MLLVGCLQLASPRSCDTVALVLCVGKKSLPSADSETQKRALTSVFIELRRNLLGQNVINEK